MTWTGAASWPSRAANYSCRLASMRSKLTVQPHGPRLPVQMPLRIKAETGRYFAVVCMNGCGRVTGTLDQSIILRETYTNPAYHFEGF